LLADAIEVAKGVFTHANVAAQERHFGKAPRLEDL
jgi:hypothetical protein